MVNVSDPVGSGLVASLAHPGANITGVTNGITGSALVLKRLELLVAIIPGLSRVGYVVSQPTAPGAGSIPESTVLAARGLGLQLQYLEMFSRDNIEATLDAAIRQAVGALYFPSSGLLGAYQMLIQDLAARHRLPAISVERDFATAGGLMSFGPNEREKFSRVAHLVDRILKGANAAGLPVEQATTFDFVVNVKTTEALGLTIPPDVAAQVTEWIP
jgi:putative tryptophan/tyrosine transport system substrate-binding protein